MNLLCCRLVRIPLAAVVACSVTAGTVATSGRTTPRAVDPGASTAAANDYDAETIPSAGVQQIEAAEAGQSLLDDVQERSVPPHTPARGTSTTSPHTFIATERGLFDVRPPNPGSIRCRSPIALQ
jgi:hypothetical protein